MSRSSRWALRLGQAACGGGLRMRRKERIAAVPLCLLAACSHLASSSGAAAVGQLKAVRDGVRSQRRSRSRWLLLLATCLRNAFWCCPEAMQALVCPRHGIPHNTQGHPCGEKGTGRSGAYLTMLLPVLAWG